MPTPDTTSLTPQELIAKTTEFSKTFLEELLKIFSSREKLNEAVKDRRTLIVDPSVRNVNDADLDNVDDQFDANGNKIEGSTFTQHSPERASSERKEFLRSENISDRESIALISAYFGASTTVILENPMLPYISKLVEAIRVTIAHELRDSAGLSDPKGFAPKQGMLDKINFLLENPFDLTNKTISYFTFFPALKKAGDDAKKLSVGHIQEQLDKIPGRAKTTKLKVKQDLLQRTHKAIDDFAVSFDATKLLSTMITIKREDDERKGKKKKATHIIDNAASIAQRYLTSLNNTASIGHSSVLLAGMYGRSASASPSPLSPNSPGMSDSSSSDDEKNSPNRSPKG